MFANIGRAIKVACCGSSNSSAPRARIVAKHLMRPEGERRYLLALPSKSPTSKRPLVIALHGAGASAEQLFGMAFPPSPLSVWLEIGEREEIVVAAADAGKGGWSDCFASDARVAQKDDVAFIAAIIDHTIAEHEVDPERVYIIGVSRGGLLTYRVAAEIPHKLAGFSAVLACMPPPDRMRMPIKPLSALIIGATADPLMPYKGGKYFYTLGFLDPVTSIEDSARFWCELAGLSGKPAMSELTHRHAWDKTRMTHYLWGEDPAQLQVGLYKIDGGGHAEPSSTQRYPVWINKLVGRQNADLEVAEAAWAFFKDKRRSDTIFSPKTRRVTYADHRSAH